jgi:uncharacterized repeat protein (TIGR01451 family)
VTAGAGQDGFVVDLTYDVVWGYVNSGDAITVSRADGAYGAAEADGVGFFWTPLWQTNGQPADVAGGDTIEVYVNGALDATISPATITGGVDVLNDQVVGTIDGAGAGEAVTVTVGAWAYQPSLVGAPQQTATTDASGNFTVTFPANDLGPHNYARVEYAASPNAVQSYLYPSGVFHVDTFLYLIGYDTPGQPVTATVYVTETSDVRWDGTTTANWPHGEYALTNVDVEPGDVVEVDLGGGRVVSTTAYALTVRTDVDAEQVTGICPPNEAVRVWVRSWSLGTYAETSTVADASGHYTATFVGFDLKASHRVYPAFADDEGDEVLLSHSPPHIVARLDQNGIYGAGDAPNAPFTATLLHDGTVYVETGTTDFGNYVSWVDFGEEITPTDMITLETATWSGTMTVADLSFDVDTDGDRIPGDADIGGWVRAEAQQWQGWMYPVHGMSGVSATVSSPFTAAFTGFDLRGGCWTGIYHFDGDDFATGVNHEVHYFEVELPWGVGGVPPSAGEIVTATLSDASGSPLASTSDDRDGNPWRFWLDDFGDYDIETGHWVTVTSENGWTAGLQVPTLTVEADPDAGVISGQGPESLLFVEHSWHDGSDSRFVPGDDYAWDRSTFGEGVEYGDWIAVRYQTVDGDRVRRRVRWPQIRAKYDMEGRSDVWGHDVPAGATIRVTVTHPVSGVIETAMTTAGLCDWCGPNDYSLGLSDGTVAPTNTVEVAFGDDLVDSMTVLPVTAEADPDTDVVTITTTPGYYVGFNADGPNGWWEWWWDHDSVEVGASGVVTFDVSGEYDIVPGTAFNVHIDQEHGHQTVYGFWLPAPALGVWKWDTGGYARPGGVYVYGIQYRNNGNGTAENTTIVDTLPMSTTYAGDTSGVVPTIGGGGVITWDLGDVEPSDDDTRFYVTLNVSSTVPTGTGVITENCVVITTTTAGDGYLDDNGSCAGPVDVWDDDVEINVDKWPNPDDPAPGQEFEYEIRWCNNRGAAVGPVWLTDTLPVSTTLVRWTPDPDHEVLWNEVVTTGGQLVLRAPGLPGDWCADVEVTLLLDPDASISTTLENSVVIAAAGDVDPDNNEDVDDGAHVSPPRYDIELDKSIRNAVTVPGGWVEAFINYRNQGNSATHVWITDTLCNGLSYDYAFWGGGQPNANQPLPDPTMVGNKLVWDLGVLPVNESRWFHVQLNISDTLSSGDVVSNCATAGITATEETPWDNVDCASTTIYSAGHPNLYVTKWVEDYEPGWDNVRYRMTLGNYGDQTVYDVYLTDTLPISTSLDGYGIDWWGSRYTDTTPSGALQVVFERVEPGWRGEIDVSARLDDRDARFRWYTNTVEIDTPTDDANPADNASQAVAFSGGEVDEVDIDVGEKDLWGCAASGPVTVTTEHETRTYGGDCWGDEFDYVFEPGDTVTVAAGAGTHPVVIEIPDPFTARASSITDTVWGKIDWLDHESVNVGLDDGPDKEVQTDGSGHYAVTFADVPRGGRGWVEYSTMVNYAEIDFHRGFQTPDLLIEVDYDGDWVGGDYEAGHTIYLTVTESGGGVKATQDLQTNGGWWSTDWEDWSPSGPDIEPADWVYGLVNSASYTTAVKVGEINGEVDVDAETVSGTIHAAWLGEPVMVRCEIHEDNGPDGIEVQNVDPDGGRFWCDFSGEWDIEPGEHVVVYYYEPDGDRVRADAPNPTPYMRVQKWSEGTPSPEGNLGFRLRYMNQGGLAAADVVISETLQGMTYITDTSGLSHSGSGAPGDPIVWQLGTVDPQEDWSAFTVFVAVTETAGNWITNTARIATSNPYDQGGPGDKESWWWTEVQANGTQLYVNKDAWTHDPVPGSEFVYVVEACNGGEDVTNSAWTWVTDTLPVSTTLVNWWVDEAGWLPVVEQDHLLVVRRPTVDVHRCSPIYLRVQLTDTVTAGDELCNEAEIFTENDTGYMGDNQVSWCHHVNDPHTNLRIGKWWGWGELVPGGRIHFEGDYGNNGNVPVSGVQITETLPVSTTLVEWRAFDRDWNEIGLISPTFVAPNRYVWDVGAIPNGDRGNFEVVLQIDSDADSGTMLTNTVEISPQPDEDGYGDNDDTAVEEVYDHGANLRVRKNHNWENDNQQLSYRLDFENVGDQDVRPVWVTDTYPVSTTYNGSWWVNHGPWITHTHDVTSGQILFWVENLDPGNSGSVGFRVDLDSPGELYRWYTNTVEITEPATDPNLTDNAYTDLAFSGAEVDWVELNVGGTGMWGCAPSGPVTVTTAYEERTYGDCWDDSFDEFFSPGDVVTVAAGAGTRPVVIEIPDPFTAHASAITDTVWGQIDALDTEDVNVSLDGGPSQDVQTDGSGHYSAAFADIPVCGGAGWVNYETSIDYADVGFHRRFQWPHIHVRVFYDTDYVEGNTSPGATVWITATDSLGSFKGAGSAVAEGNGEYYVSDVYSGTQQTDIVPTDWVTALSSDGVSTTMQVIQIEGDLDVGADTISGTMSGPGATFPAQGMVRVHTPDDDWYEWELAIGSAGGYFLDMSAQHDVVPGDEVQVFYNTWGHNQAERSFWEPAPDLSVGKDGDGQPAPGGNYIYHIYYHNYGDKAASGVVITDTLPADMSYITDTSPFTHTGTPSGPIVWHLGTVEGGAESFFDVFVSVDSSLAPGDTVTNVVDIATPDVEPNTGNNHHEWPTDVITNDTHLNVGKDAWTHDPAPGYDVVFNVNVCNNGNTGSSKVVITDTLHPSMTLKNWWGQHAGWTEVVSESHRLVVSRPSIDGWRCSEVYVEAHVADTASSGLWISNTAVISASNDLEGGDNESTRWVNVSDPYASVRINKWWGGGQLVPGGEIRFHGDYYNDGNTPVSNLQITETLPVSTTLVAWREYDRHWNEIGLISPTFVPPNQYVWDLGEIPNGHWGNFEVVLQIDSDPDAVGTVLTNTVEISRPSTEDDDGDNVATVVETVYDHGRNLRVDKSGDWYDEGTDTRSAGYGILIWNVGDVQVSHVTVTDTYPVSMTLDWFDTEWEALESWHDNPASHTFTATYESLGAGDSMWIRFDAGVPGSGPLPCGLIFTNTAEVTLDPDDTHPDDNVDEVVLTSGPDLYVEKELVDGELLPGELITFSLVFGNDHEGHEWWWGTQGDTWMTDTLPAGLVYVTSTLHWCGWTDWCAWPPDSSDGSHVVWQLGQWSGGGWNEAYLTVRITDTATGLDTFTNTLEIASDQPISDTEPYYDNNTDTYAVSIALPHFQVAKAYESSRIAASPVTYTLTVTNTGHVSGTNVVLSDTVPTGLTYGGGDGTFHDPDITWTFDVGVGAAVGNWFSATLPCSGTISNDDYGVVSSDQGVVSAPGPAVDLTVVAPTLNTDFDQSAASVEVNDTVGFTDTSTTNGPDIVEWAWDFGDGSPSAFSQDASHQYTTVDTFTVTLTITDACGYTDSQTGTVTVESGATADFTASPTMGVAPLTVVFTNTSTGGYASSLWAFGDGAISTEDSPTHTYAAGVYTVSLTVDASDTLTRTNYITACHSADINCDCVVDVKDVQAVAGNWRCEVGGGCYDERQDLDGDGIITVIDIMKVVAHWGWTCGGGPLAVPSMPPPWWWESLRFPGG